MNKQQTLMRIASGLVVAGVLAACATPVVTPQTIIQTQVVTQIVAGTPVEQIVEVTAPPATETPKQFEGVTVNVLTFVGPQVAEPLQRRGPDFEKLTGAHINVITVPNSDLYQKALTDLSTGTNSYDAFLFAPSWIVDFAPNGYLEDLTPRINADPALQWDDVAPFFRDFNSYQGKVYSLPLDGDMHTVYYRSDVLKAAGMEPPQTWDDYLAIAKKFQGQDLNGDGTPDYGSCIAKAPNQQSYWWITSVAAPYIQSQGTAQGAFFNTTNMDPLVNNDAFKKALDVYKETTQYGPPDELNLGVGDTRGLFISGRCALTMDWGDIGTLAIDKDNSKVIDKVGAVQTPGSKEVLDWTTGKLVPCDAKTCPYAINGVNHAPFASFGGWAGAVNAAADPKVKDAAYAFFSYMSQPAQSNIDVTLGKTGYNPFRFSQFLNREQWVKAGFTPAAASDYLGAIEASLNNPNMVLDLRVPHNHDYQQVALDKEVAQFLAGDLTTDQAAQAINDDWNKITDDAGRDKQLAAYKATIGAK
jgi:multiple sugar transport system substrate-binding protein